MEGTEKSASWRSAVQLDEEEEELWRQLRRKRDFEERVDEKRIVLADLHLKKRGVHSAFAEVCASVEHLEDELRFVLHLQKELEHDIAVLQESNRLLENAWFQAPLGHGQVQAAGLPATRLNWSEDMLNQEKVRHETAQAQHHQIEQLRLHIENLRTEKDGLQQRQQALFTKKHSAEQDRNRILGSLQDDRNSLNEVRAERIRLLAERMSLDREIAAILQEVQLKSISPTGEPADRRQWSPSRRNGTLAADLQVQRRPPAVPGSSGGVRGDVPQSSASLFTTNLSESSPPWVQTSKTLRSGSQDSRRPHWTSFDDGNVVDIPTATQRSKDQDLNLPIFGSVDGGKIRP